jgi:hypothetical protein
MNNLMRQIMNRQAVARAPVGGGMAFTPEQSPSDRPPILRGLTQPVTVTSANAQLAPSDYDRRFLFIQNNDTTGSVWLSFGAPAQLGVGIKLAAGGGGILLDNNVPTAQINAIGTIASNANVTLITG